jgi:hypothetical protein
MAEPSRRFDPTFPDGAVRIVRETSTTCPTVHATPAPIVTVANHVAQPPSRAETPHEIAVPPLPERAPADDAGPDRT